MQLDLKVSLLAISYLIPGLQAVELNYERYLPSDKYNVLFICIDDFKPIGGLFADHDHQSSIKFPNAITPNLDRFAESAINFRNNYCQVPVCAASRNSTLTGLRPDTINSWEFGDKIRDLVPNAITLPQYFGANGYTTYSIGKIFHDEDPLSWNDGYLRPRPENYYYQSPGAEIEDGIHPDVNGFTGSIAYSTDAGEFHRDGSSVNDESYHDGLVASAAEEKISEYAAVFNASGVPFFLGVGFRKPHLPFSAPKAYWDLYDRSKIDATDFVTPGAASDPPLIDSYIMPEGTPRFAMPYNTRGAEFNTYWDTNKGRNPGALYEKETAERLVHGYLACVSYVDTQVGRVLEALELAGVADNTIVVIWSDHGWHLADHKGFWGKHSLFEQATTTPLLIRTPGMDTLGSAGQSCFGFTELVDIYPTLVDLVGLPNPEMPDGLVLEGISLRPLLQDPNVPWKKAAFSQFPENIFNEKIDGSTVRETYQFNNPQRNVFVDGKFYIAPGMGYSIRTDRYRYTEYWQTFSNELNDAGYIINKDVKFNNTPQFTELYDYIEDSAETRNLAYNDAYADIVATLRAALAGGNGWGALEVSPPTLLPKTWQAWKAAYQPVVGADAHLEHLEDPDQDELTNIFEYKMGTHPFRYDEKMGCGLTWMFDGDHRTIVSFEQVDGRDDIELRLEQSDDISDKSGWLKVEPTSRTQLDGGKTHFSFDLTLEPVGETRFFRLAAEPVSE